MSGVTFEFPDDVSDEDMFAVVKAFKNLMEAIQPGDAIQFQITSMDRDPTRNPDLDGVVITIGDER